jgi:hypothetical protein
MRTIFFYLSMAIIVVQLTRWLLRRAVDRLVATMVDPDKKLSAEEDPYFNREYARPTRPKSLQAAKPQKVAS